MNERLQARDASTTETSKAAEECEATKTLSVDKSCYPEPPLYIEQTYRCFRPRGHAGDHAGGALMWPQDAGQAAPAKEES